MASNKKAQILAAVMCASSIFGSYTMASAAETPASPTKIEGSNSSVTAGSNKITAIAGADGAQQSTITLNNGSLSIDVGKQTVEGTTTYGTFSLNSKNLTVSANTGLTVNNANGTKVASISNAGAITGTGLTVNNTNGKNLATLNNAGLYIYDGINTNATASISKAGTISGKGLTVNGTGASSITSDDDKGKSAKSEVSYSTSVGIRDTVTNGDNKAISQVLATSVKDTVTDGEKTTTSTISANGVGINVGYNGGKYEGTFTLNSKNLIVSSYGVTVKSTDGTKNIASLTNNTGLRIYNSTDETNKTYWGISNTGAIIGAGLTIKDDDATTTFSVSKSGNIKANDGMTVVDKVVSNDVTTTATTTTAATNTGIINKIEKVKDESEKLSSTGTSVTATAVTTTAQGDGKSAFTGDSNKTTSKVESKGVTDTVYNAEGTKVAVSTVLNNGIKDTFYGDNATYTVTTDGNGTKFAGTGKGTTTIDGGTIKASGNIEAVEDIKAGDVSLKNLANAVEHISVGNGTIDATKLAGIDRDSKTETTTIENATSFNENGITTKAVNGVTIGTYTSPETRSSANVVKDGDILIGVDGKENSKINLSAIDRNTTAISYDKQSETTSFKGNISATRDVKSTSEDGKTYSLNNIGSKFEGLYDEENGDIVLLKQKTQAMSYDESTGTTKFTGDVTSTSEDGTIYSLNTIGANTQAISYDESTGTTKFTGDVKSTSEDGKIYSLNAIGSEFEGLYDEKNGDIALLKQKTDGITRTEFNTELGDYSVTSIEGAIKVSSTGAIYLNADNLAFSYTKNGDDTGFGSLGKLANRVDDLEQKTQGISYDEKTGTTTIDGNLVVKDETTGGEGGATGEGGDITSDSVTTGNIKADKGNIGGVTMEGGTISGDNANISNKVTIGGENGTNINKDGITVGKAEEGQSYTSITKDDVKVTDSQGNTTSLTDVGNRVTGLESSVNSMNNRLNDVEDRIDKVGAMSAAIANLRTMGFDPEAPTEIAIGVGQYKSETGIALGVFHYPNQDFMLSASISTSGDEVMGGIGATWKLGRKSAAEKAKDEEAKRLEKAEEMKKLAQEAKVKAQAERHAKLLAEREAHKIA